MPEYEAHLSSYEHTHNQRRKDAKQFHKNPFGKDSSETSRRNEEREKKAAGMTSVKVEQANTPGKLGGGFKKGGFKSAGFKKVNQGEGANGAEQEERRKEVIPGLNVQAGGDVDMGDDGEEAEGEDQSRDYSFWCEKDPGYEYYDPTRPGGCNGRCPCRAARREQCGKGCELCAALGPVPG
jgi:hypothetical protein